MPLSDSEKQDLEKSLNKNYDSLAALLPEGQKQTWLDNKSKIIGFCLENGVLLTAGIPIKTEYDEGTYEAYQAACIGGDPAPYSRYRFEEKAGKQKICTYDTTGIAGLGPTIAQKLLQNLLILVLTTGPQLANLSRTWIADFDKKKSAERLLLDNYGCLQTFLPAWQQQDWLKKRESIVEWCLLYEIHELVANLRNSILIAQLVALFKTDKGSYYSIPANLIQDFVLWVGRATLDQAASSQALCSLIAAEDTNVANQYRRTKTVNPETLLTALDMSELLKKRSLRYMTYELFEFEKRDPFIRQDLKTKVQKANLEIFLPVNYSGHWFYFLRNGDGNWFIKDSQVTAKKGLVEASKAFLHNELGIPLTAISYESTKLQHDNYSCGTQVINAYRNTKDSHQAMLDECLRAELTEEERSQLGSNIFAKEPEAKSVAIAKHFVWEGWEDKEASAKFEETRYEEPHSSIKLPTPNPRLKIQTMDLVNCIEAIQLISALDKDDNNKKFFEAFTTEATRLEKILPSDEKDKLGELANMVYELANVGAFKEAEGRPVSQLRNGIKTLCNDEICKREEWQVITGIALAMVGVACLTSAALVALVVGFGTPLAVYAAIAAGGVGVAASFGAAGICFFGRPATRTIEGLTKEWESTLSL